MTGAQQMPSLPPLPRPKGPFFGSGPTAKRPGWSVAALQHGLVSRSHRSLAGQGKIKALLDETRALLQIPDDYKIALMPGSATGAMEALLWSLLGPRSVECIALDVFSARWAWDMTEQLSGLNVSVRRDLEKPGANFHALDFNRDVVFLWNYSTGGIGVLDGTFIPDDRDGLTLCDATSAVFCVPIPFHKIDATAFSWQKGLGGEGGLGMIVLSPRAIERLETHRPTWPIPYLFRLRDFQGHHHNRLFEGDTLNTPSLLCIEDALDGLAWARSLGGMDGLWGRTRANAGSVYDWVSRSTWARPLCTDPLWASQTTVAFSVCDERVADPWAVIGSVASCLDGLQIAYDIKNHRAATPSFRLWCGPTVERSDLLDLLPWLDWAVARSLD